MPSIIYIVAIMMLSFSYSYAETEDWYVMLSYGEAENVAPDDIEQVITDNETTSGTHRVSSSAEIAMYWPGVNKKLLFGFALNASVDRVNNQDTSANEFSHNTYNISGSVLQFVDGTVGRGFYYRADIGRASSEFHYQNGDITVNGSGNSLLVGIGYSYVMTRGTRLIYSLNALDMNINHQRYTSSQLALGILW